MLHILLAIRGPALRSSLRLTLSRAGHRVSAASNGAEALALTAWTVFDVVLSDVKLPKISGLALLRRVRQQSPNTDVVLLAASDDVPAAVAALREGAYDCLDKSRDLDDLVRCIERLAAKRSSTQVTTPQPRSAIVGRSPPIQRLLGRIEVAAQSSASVLITGESGCGKELVARTLHEWSPRRAKPFVAVSCTALPETLLEAELFGHTRGAFTGAVQRRDGRFKVADGGTLLLDEIAEISLSAQAKILRVLEEGTVEPLGSNEVVKVDVRIVAATHKNLKEQIAKGTFREDLFYRLNVLDLQIAPLRERRGDLALLLRHFLRKHSRGQPSPGVSPRAWALLSRYSFPGNVREFSHAIEHAVVLAGAGEIGIEHLPDSIRGNVEERGAHDGGPRPLSSAVMEFEREYLSQQLAQAGGKRGRAALILGICRKNLWEKLRKHRIAGAVVSAGVDVARSPQA